MVPMSLIVFLSLVIMTLSLSGGILMRGWAGSVIERNLSILISFAVGVFSITVINLVTEVYEVGGLFSAVGWLVVGAVGVYLMSHVIPEYHHHHFSAKSSHNHSGSSARKILLSDAIHNIADGILITVSVISGGMIAAGVVISIIVHELIQELTEFFILRQAGYTTFQALRANFLVSATILIGSIGSFFFLAKFQNLEVPLLGIAAGGFMLALFQDLIPDSFQSAKASNTVGLHLIALIFGAMLMIGISMFGAH